MSEMLRGGGGVIHWFLSLAAVSCSIAWAQGPVPAQIPSRAPAIQAGPSDSVLFRFFFLHVASVESIADNLKASGKNDLAARSKFARDAKLTEVEASLLKDVARRCNSGLEAHTRNEVAPAVQNLRAQNPAASRASALPPPAAAQLKELDRQHERIVTDHVQELKSAMGPERFQKLYEYVRGTEAPRIKQAPIPLPQARQK